MNLFERLFPADGASRLWILIDPDSDSPDALGELAGAAEKDGAAVILIGGSFLYDDTFDSVVKAVKKVTSLPVVIFPGNSRQLSHHADGILFTSLLSGRNPQYLIGEQVQAAPIIRRMAIPSLSTAYLLVESGKTTSAEYISNTRPLPRDKPLIAVAHAQAAELLGMSAVYLEAGSGAEKVVPAEMIRLVSEAVSIPLIVGGGITGASEAVTAAHAGARAIVVGNAVERGGRGVIGEIAYSLKEL